MGDDRSPARDCPDHALLLRYVRGELPEDEAAAAEEHYFACNRCWQDVERALELRAAFAEGRDAEGVEGLEPHLWRRPAFVAAAAAILAFGLWLWAPAAREEPKPTVLRGDTMVLELAVARTTDELVISWPEVHRAESYLVQFQDPAGRLLLEEETTGNALTLGWKRLPSPRVGEVLAARVQALDSMRQTLASSEFANLPSRPR